MTNQARPYLLKIFGSPSLVDAGGGGVDVTPGKRFALLSYLTLSDRPVARETLIELLWPTVDRKRARASLRQALWSLRSVLGPDVVIGDGTLAIASGAVLTELDLLREAVDRQDLDAILALWTGPPLQEFVIPNADPWADWAEDFRLQQTRWMSARLSSRAAAFDGTGDPRAKEWWRAAIAVEPLNAAHHRCLVESLIGAGSESAAEEAVAQAQRLCPEEGAEWSAMLRSLGAIRLRNAAPPLAGFRTEMIGRAHELGVAIRLWREAAAGKRRVLVVQGEAGIGKTRLSEEAASLANTSGGTVLWTGGNEAERLLSFGLVWELANALYGKRGAAGISETSRSVLRRFGLDSDGSHSVTADSGGDVELRLADALLDLIGAVAEESPLLVVVDDLQWIDKASCRVLANVVRRSARDAVMFLVNARTEVPDPALVATVSSLTRLEGCRTCHLGPLRLPDVSEILSSVLDSDDPVEIEKISRRLHAVSQGNPFDVFETLRLLLDRGHLVPVQEGWEWCGTSPEDVPLPESRAAVLTERIDGLSDVAARVADAVARGRPGRSGKPNGPGPEEWERGAAELLRHGLAVVDEDGGLRFVHDRVREEVARRGTSGPHESNRLLRTPGTLLVTTGLAAGALLWFAAPSGEGETFETHPYGAGSVYALGTEGLTEFAAPRREGDVWSPDPSPLAVLPFQTHWGPFRTTDAFPLWGGTLEARGDPDVAPAVGLMDGGGEVREVLRTDGDVGFLALSPDGRRVLMSAQQPVSATYGHVAVTMPSDGDGSPASVYVARERIRSGAWSPDGTRIALAVSAATDTILILTPTGRRVGSFSSAGIRTVLGLSWCADSRTIVFQGHAGSLPRAMALDTGSGAYRELGNGASSNAQLACVGQSTGVVFAGLQPGGTPETQLLIHDLRTDSVTSLGSWGPGPLRSLAWVPDSVAPIVQSIRVDDDLKPLIVGETRTLSATGLWSDGSRSPVVASWRSLDPASLWAGEDGLIAANAPDSAQVVAEFAGWLVDTATIEIAGPSTDQVLFSDDFRSSLSMRWRSYGDAPPVRIETADGPLLSLPGDGQYSDGVRSHDTFPVAGGATLELVFRIPLTRTQQQFFIACLEGSDWNPADPAARDGWLVQEAVCLRYPGEELLKQDERRAMVEFVGTGIPEFVLLPDGFDSSDWTHLALELRPDGRLNVLVDRELVATSTYGATLTEGSRWRINLKGASVGTGLEVRNVVVWPGVRSESVR